MELSLRPADVENESLLERKTILVVDEEALVRQVLQDFLEDYGYNVLTATDGVEAYGLFMKEYAHIDLLVSEVLMPKMNGFYAYQLMCGIKPGLKAILVSGHPNSAEIIKHESLNIPEFISKPISSKELLVKIHDMLNDA